MISDRDIIRLHLSLELPRMVGEMLDRRLPIADDEAYALEVALSEMTSEKFLLAAGVARYMALEKFLDEGYRWLCLYKQMLPLMIMLRVILLA